MKKIVISGIKMPVNHSENEILEKALKIADRRGISAFNPIVCKKSLDARRKSDIHYVYSVVLETSNLKDSALGSEIRLYTEPQGFELIHKQYSEDFGKTVLIVGSGPCGLFAAYILASCGIKTILIERGSTVDIRQKKIEKFWQTGVLDPNTNIQFGEGGAGTFSDGKLNTGIGSPLQHYVLKTFVDCGAPKEIMYLAKPHIGTDILKDCVKNLREKIKQLGGEVLFDTCLTDIIVKDNRILGAQLNNSSYLECDALVLAPGHSGRDTYELLERRNVKMEQKPFAAGVRIEHKREFINQAQYGDFKGVEALPTADYRLAYNGESRSCYSFCMCPGGTVINASSEKEQLCVNGMSEHSRMADNSNSALVVNVRPHDFDGDSPLAGVEFQRKYESLAYSLCKGKGPIQLARDFVRNKTSSSLDGVTPSFTGDTELADLRQALPGCVSDTLTEGLLYFEKKIKGFATGGAVLTGIEMRTSAPLRIKRDENFESISHKGLFPAGEGAGYAGGIMSAAVDGIKVAKSILNMWQNGI